MRKGPAGRVTVRCAGRHGQHCARLGQGRKRRLSPGFAGKCKVKDGRGGLWGSECRGECRETSVLSPGRERGYMFLGGNCGDGGKAAVRQPADEGRVKRRDIVFFGSPRRFGAGRLSSLTKKQVSLWKPMFSLL